MYRQFKEIIARAHYLDDEALKYGFYFSILRSVLQMSSIVAFDLSWEVAEGTSKVEVSALSKTLLQPSDGDFITTLDTCLQVLRFSGWRNCAPDWFDTSQNAKKEGFTALRSLCIELVKERNSRMGHGVIDQASVLEGLQTLPSKLGRILDGLKDILPDASAPASIVGAPFDNNILSFSPAVPGPVIIRKYAKAGSCWRGYFQTLDPIASEEDFFEVPDNAPIILALDDSGSPLKTRLIFLESGEWRPSYLLPNKQTETFEGRTSELNDLLEWWNDVDSRASLVYGEGGVGKTTLVLHFLHAILDGSVQQISWHPDLIYYYSAKQTRWTVNGLEYLKGVMPTITDSLRNLAMLFDKGLGRDWLKEDVRSVVDKSAAFFKELGLRREQILIVLDNTETLAKTHQEETELGRAMRQISTKIGRVLMTSRRLERVEAFPIQVIPMDSETGAVLLRRLGQAYSASSLIQAGDNTLRKASAQLSGKPLLMDVLAKHISISNSGIEEGLRTVLRHVRSDLGKFLYEDAWSRMDENQQNVFLVVGQLGGAIAGVLVAWACGELGVYLTDWIVAFNETRFGTYNDYGNQFDISLEPSAREFLVTKYNELKKDAKAIVDKTTNAARRHYEDLLRAAEVVVTDRVVTAFRTSAAKAAKIAAERGDFEEAVMWFEEAITGDPGNFALLDRFAWFLMVNKKLERAWGVAQKACFTGSDDADAHFTAGMVAGRMGNIADADRFLDLAERKGKGAHLCCLQKARARIEKSKVELDLQKTESYLEEGKQLLGQCTLNSPCGYKDMKHERERRRLNQMITTLEAVRLSKKPEPQVILRGGKEPRGGRC